MNWSELLKNQRQKIGFTQIDLAQKSGVSLPSIQKIEAGKANPSLKTLQKLAQCLDVEIIFQVAGEKTFTEESKEPKNIIQDLGEELSRFAQNPSLEKASQFVFSKLKSQGITAFSRAKSKE